MTSPARNSAGGNDEAVSAESAGQDERPLGRFGTATLGSAPLSVAVLPEPEEAQPRRRRRWLIASSVVVVLALIAGALLGGRVWGRHGTTSVWLITRDIAAGQALQPTDVRSVRVADAVADGAVSTATIPSGQVATRSLQQGQVLRTGALGRQAAVPTYASALVGVALPAGTAPLREIVPGDPVTVLKLPPPPSSTTSGSPAPVGTSRVILPRVEVISITGSGSGAVATLLVPASAVQSLTALSAANRVAIVRVP